MRERGQKKRARKRQLKRERSRERERDSGLHTFIHMKIHTPNAHTHTDNICIIQKYYSIVYTYTTAHVHIVVEII